MLTSGTLNRSPPAAESASCCPLLGAMPGYGLPSLLRWTVCTLRLIRMCRQPGAPKGRYTMHPPLLRTPRRPTQRLAAWLIAALLAVAIVVLLGACGSSTNPSSSASASAMPAATATWTAADLSAITPDPSLKALLPASIVNSNNLVVASDIPWPPWEMYVSATSKQVTGLDYDLSQAIGKKIGIPTSFVNTPFDGIVLAIKGGRRDMIMSAMGDHADREKAGVTFVDYAYDGSGFVILKNNPQNITTLDSIAGKVVALQQWNAQFKKAGKQPAKVVTLPNGPACVLAVSSGRAACYCTDNSSCHYIADTNAKTFKAVVDPTEPSGYNPAPNGIGILATNTGLISAVQRAMQDLLNQGVYQKILGSYGLAPCTSIQINQGSAKHPVGLPAASGTAASASPSS
jgi:polar amino acid transport system substrate-binding protein